MDHRQMLELYIHDYLVKKNLINSAKTFTEEAQLPPNQTIIDASNSFLWEWWCIFWDTYSRSMANDEASNMNANVQQLQQQQPSMISDQQMLQQLQQQPSMTSNQQMLLHLQQQQPSINSEQQMLQQLQQLQTFRNSDQQTRQQLQQQQASMHSDQLLQQLHQMPVSSDQQMLQQMQAQLLHQQRIQQQQQQRYLQQKQLHQLRIQHSTTRSSLANQIVAAHNMNPEDLQHQKDVLSEVEAERYIQTSVKTSDQLFPRPTDATSSRSTVGGDQPIELKIRNLPARNCKSSYGMKDGKWVFLGAEGLKNSGIPPLTCTASGSNMDLNSSPLKGWPLRGFDQLQPGVSSHQTNLPHLDQNSQYQLHQQNRGLLLDHNIDKENIRTDKDWIGHDKDSVPVGTPISSLGNAWTSQQQQRIQKYMQPLSLEPLAQRSNYQPQLTNRASAVGNTWREVAISNTSKDNDQTSKDQTSKKRKQPMLSEGPATSSTTANVASPSSVSAPLAPPEDANDVISLPPFPRDYNSSKADLENAVDKVSLEDGVGSFLSSDVPETGSETAGILDAIQDTAFLEIASLKANGVKFCDLSLDGKFIATGGDDKKVALWCTELGQKKCELEHSGPVTDLCFGPRLPKIATSSLDETVKIWNVNSPGSPVRTFAGHYASVLSVDFHPKKEDIVCSCDDANSIRYWSIKDGYCTGMHMSSATQVRFEPTSGKYLAASIENGVSIFNVETMQKYTCPPKKCHATAVRSMCWNSSGDFLASMSEDTVRVWKIGSWGLDACVYELKFSDKKLRCCSFDPRNSSMLLIGSDESLELWHMAENKMVSVIKEPTLSLTALRAARVIASVSDNSVVKVWK